MKVVGGSHVVLAVTCSQVVIDIFDSMSVFVATSSASYTSLALIKLGTAKFGNHRLLALDGSPWVVVQDPTILAVLLNLTLEATAVRL